MVIPLSDRKRGQIHTVEAVAAAILILTGVVFAQAITAVTPMTASTASQHAENQQGELAIGFTTITNSDETLKNTILYWDNTDERFHDSQGETIYYTINTPNSEFGDLAQSHFIDRGLGLHVTLEYYRDDGTGELEQVSVPYMDFGTASNHAYTATTIVTLYDSDPLINEDGTENSVTLEDGSSTHFMNDADPDSEIYNIVEVNITIWRI